MPPTFHDDDEPIAIEIRLPAPPSTDEEVTRDLDLSGILTGTRGRVQTITDEALFNGFKSIYKVARKTQVLLADLSAQTTTHPLAEAEVTFGLSFSASGVPFITVGAEATLSVTLKWQRPG